VSATSEHIGKSKKGFFLAQEKCERGDSRALSDVISRLAFNDKGLIPAVAQDARSGEVLMLAWMNQPALGQTIATRQMTYFSRSRNELWIKGQTSGNYQKFIEMRTDCDGDALLCRIEQTGSACHTDRRSCFYLAADLTDRTVHVIS
jgi:phosphoribosyl-AMP cyclohydrolase